VRRVLARSGVLRLAVTRHLHLCTSTATLATSNSSRLFLEYSANGGAFLVLNGPNQEELGTREVLASTRGLFDSKTRKFGVESLISLETIRLAAESAGFLVRVVFYQF